MLKMLKNIVLKLLHKINGPDTQKSRDHSETVFIAKLIFWSHILFLSLGKPRGTCFYAI